jgi:hypothetical protein
MGVRRNDNKRRPRVANIIFTRRSLNKFIFRLLRLMIGGRHHNPSLPV